MFAYPRRGSPESGLDVVEELAEDLLRRQRPRHGVVAVVHRRVVLVQQEQQPDLKKQFRVRFGGGGASNAQTAASSRQQQYGSQEAQGKPSGGEKEAGVLGITQGMCRATPLMTDKPFLSRGVLLFSPGGRSSLPRPA